MLAERANGNHQLLELRGVGVAYKSGRRQLKHVVSDVDFEIRPGESVGLVGESGSGKTTLTNAILGRVPVSNGSILFEGKDVGRVPLRSRGPLRRDIQMIFQNPTSALNPSRSIRSSLLEALSHRNLTAEEKQGEMVAALNAVGIEEDALWRFPASFSGGQKQRISIARAVLPQPKLLICDEPVSALDPTVQQQVLKLLEDIGRERRLSMLFISHDLDVVRRITTRTAVIYRGRLQEFGTTRQVLEDPQSPYTKKLLGSTLIADPRIQSERRALKHSLGTN